MKKQLVVIGIIVLLVCVGLSGCTNNSLDTEKNKFVGTWNTAITESNTRMFLFIPCEFITFYSNGTFRFGFPSLLSIDIGSWDINDGKFIFEEESMFPQQQFDCTYQFSNNDRTLTITYIDGKITSILTRQ
jgi:hypothetical protein